MVRGAGSQKYAADYGGSESLGSPIQRFLAFSCREPAALASFPSCSLSLLEFLCILPILRHCRDAESDREPILAFVTRKRDNTVCCELI